MSSKYYVANAIPYVNGAPHIGHALEAVCGDAIARYQRLQGNEVMFSYGTDEHGGKVLENAKTQGVTPKRFVDEITQSFVDMTKMLDISYDKWLRTTSKEHHDAVAKIWKNLSKYIYKGKYEGVYDQKQEEFITVEQAKKIEQEDPEHFKHLQPISEDNYFFKLSVFGPTIKKAIESDELRIIPETRKHEVMALLEQGLKDISVSRPKSKIPWGIPVPGDKDQTVYVWFEALMNYITTLGYPDGELMQKFWPTDMHVLGKDIIRFHAAIWPAMLLALELPLPKAEYVHGFITSGGRKMSKSFGNGVDPTDMVSQYGSDATRYYLLRHIPSHDDGDFTWEKFETVYNTELGNDLGNLVQRTATMLVKYQDGVIGEIPEPEHDEGPYHEAMEDIRMDAALEYVWGLIRGLNQYLEEEKPWEVADKQDYEHVREILVYVVGSLMQISDLLEPFLPKTAGMIKEIFKQGVVKTYKGVMFPKVENYVNAKAAE